MRLRDMAACAALCLAACKKTETKPAPAVSATAPVSVVAPSSARPPALKWRTPVGPVLAVVPGKGVGPIRIGATRETIERHMQAPCEEATETLCRYVIRAVDFHLRDGKLFRVELHRQERPAGGVDKNGEPRTYGVFNGGIPPDLRFGMIPSAIQEHLGQPKKIDKVEEPNPFNTKERHHYDGMLIEYDLYKNGNLIMGGVTIPG